jgi:hypothetical protein
MDRAPNIRVGLLMTVVGLLLVAGCTDDTAERRCLKRVEAEYGYQARWVRCPADAPVVLPDDY